RAALTDHTAAIAQVERDARNTPTRLVLDSVPANLNPAAGLDFTLYAPDGTTQIGALKGTIDRATKVFTLGGDNNPDVVNAIAEGAHLRLDNHWFLALSAYYRYTVPHEPGYAAYDQFRDANGQPIYPQRPVEVGPLVASSVAGGGTFTGKITGKVIVVSNLLDPGALPYQADWYANRVKAALGAGYEDNFRLWYNDNADHLDGPVTGPKSTRIVSYDGILQQALRDISAWVERGVAPVKSTQYNLKDGQVTVPADAQDRRGVQPVVDLSAAGGTGRVEVRAGQPVTFTAGIEAPPAAGKIVSTEWDFNGTGEFTATPFGTPRPCAEVSATFTYPKPGTYIASLRVTSQRDGDATTPFTKVQNLGRIQIVVR
ncbi:MAG: PKD domain-containing protein, partial [Streptomycetaceae bacterium]|nr:PKD domain-containing protein [Streptomycetaceae bacterium]